MKLVSSLEDMHYFSFRETELTVPADMKEAETLSGRMTKKLNQFGLELKHLNKIISNLPGEIREAKVGLEMAMNGSGLPISKSTDDASVLPSAARDQPEKNTTRR